MDMEKEKDEVESIIGSDSKGGREEGDKSLVELRKNKDWGTMVDLE